MTQRPAKRIPQWLTIDLLVIVVSLAIIGIYLYGLAIIFLLKALRSNRWGTQRFVPRSGVS